MQSAAAPCSLLSLLQHVTGAAACTWCCFCMQPVAAHMKPACCSLCCCCCLQPGAASASDMLLLACSLLSLLLLLAAWRYFCVQHAGAAAVCRCLQLVLMLLLAAWRYSCMQLAAACLQPECSGAATAACGLALFRMQPVCYCCLRPGAAFACNLLLPDAVCCGCHVRSTAR